MAFRGTCESIHSRHHCLAYLADSSLGRVLPLALFFQLGVIVLFLGHQLFDGRLWRRHAPATLAHSGPSRERNGRDYVWYLRELPVRDRDPVDRE